MQAGTGDPTPGAETRRKAGIARLSVPLFAHGRVLGTLALDRRERWSSPRERELVRSFAELASQALYALTVRCELYDLARTDPLTGAGNRRRLVEELERLIDLGTPFRMLFVDVDGLKAVNDKLGFEKGDRLIVALAEALTSTTKPEEAGGPAGRRRVRRRAPRAVAKKARKRARRFEQQIERLPVSRRIRRHFNGASTGDRQGARRRVGARGAGPRRACDATREAAAAGPVGDQRVAGQAAEPRRPLISGRRGYTRLEYCRFREGARMSTTATITEHEQQQVERANATGLTPVVFVHGLWLLPSSWDRWADGVRGAPASRALTPGWPDDPETVEEAKAHPEVFAHKTVGQVADHFDDVIGKLDEQARGDRPLVRRAARADPRRPRALGGDGGRSTRRRSAACCRCRSRRCESARPVLGNPANRDRAVPLTYEQFRYASPTRSPRTRPRSCTRRSPSRRPGAPLFQAATANLNPWTEAKVDTKNPERGPLLIISGEKDHTVPWAIANASFKQQKRNEGVTEIVEIPDRGHALTIDSGWREVADTALAFVKRFAT